MYYDLTAKLVELWTDLYRRRPVPTVVISVIVAGLFAGVVVVADRDAERRRAQSTSYTTQLAQIEQVQTSLTELASFLDDQKASLRKTQDTLQQLRGEKRRLEPIVQADRETLNAILALQEQRQARAAWIERAIGFVSGFAASLIASVAFAIVFRRKLAVQ